jgi:hypothetical protein
MLKIIFYLVFIFFILNKASIAQKSQSNAAGTAGHSMPEQNLNPPAIFSDSHRGCEVAPGCFYSNVSSFECGESKVVINSTCVSNDEFNSDPYCFTQNVGFVNRPLSQVRSFIYYYEKDSQKYISAAKCIKAEQGYYVELESTNLGNCKTCEWSDYFEEAGQYIGSENGRYGKTSFARKLVPLKKKGMLQKGRFVQRIDIETIAQ